MRAGPGFEYGPTVQQSKGCVMQLLCSRAPYTFLHCILEVAAGIP